MEKAMIKYFVLYVSIFGLTTLSVAFGAVPAKSHLTDDTAIYQKVSEIKVPKASAPDFDADIDRLSAIEGQYKENLPKIEAHYRLVRPMQRVAAQKYRYSGRSSNL
jgi:hypothetical protein